MSFEYKADLSELKKFLERLGGRGQVLNDEALKAGNYILTQARLFMVHYPVPPGRGFGFVSAKQRRWFWWALKSGVIQVPYRRTNTLGRGWNYELTVRAQGENITEMRGGLRNDTPYTQYVQDEIHQARIHRGRWTNTIQAVKIKMGAYMGIALQEAQKNISAWLRSTTK